MVSTYFTSVCFYCIYFVDNFLVAFQRENINTLASGCFRALLKKNCLNARGFAREYLRSYTGYGPGRRVKRCGKSSSLHSKKIFCLGGCVFFCEWHHK